ncbi:MAG TPA: caspase family protein [Burkholderiales bacterium]|nr:caspase family protein [Burkholderiales bacterium]
MSRRQTLKRLLALAGAATLHGRPLPLWAQTRGDQVVPGKRQALVFGNTAYTPDRQSIPSSRKNATDVGAALSELGFEVRREVDQGVGAMRAMLRDFFASVKSSGGPPLAILYYTGHGIQFRGENYLVPSDVKLDQSAESIARDSINIDREIIAEASLPNDGTCALIFDACRNDPTRNPKDAGGSFNQVNPPRGTVITFSTAPGKFAIAPRSPDENSIYTAILVEELKKANPAISIKDFLDAVKFRVKRSMESSEDKFLRTHAQDPEVAANLRLRMSLVIEKLEEKKVAPVPVDDAEEKAWALIDQTVVPAERLKLLKDFIEKFPKSRFQQAAQVQLERAVLSEAATQRNRVQIDEKIGDAEFKAEQAKALDGDKDAAFRVGQMFERGSNGVPADERRMVQWLRHASELKNGIASYRLYQYYNSKGLDRDAVRYENRAREQGYVLPERLATTR